MKRESWMRLMLIGAVMFLVAACGPAPVPEGAVVPTDEPAQEAAFDDSAGGESAVVAPVDLIEGELEFIEIEAGDGEQAAVGDRVAVHYTGTLDDGTVFDSSLERGVPFEFVLGRGEVIPGWDQGIAMMREGGRATLVIPPNLGYGVNGSGTIPPNATLTFEVELISVEKPPQPTEVDAGDYEESDTGLQLFDIEAGDGETAVDGDRVSIDFKAWAMPDTVYLAGSEDQGQPIITTLGSGELFPGWEEGISGMTVGGVRQLLIPETLAPGVVGPGESLLMEVTLIEIREPLVPVEVDEADYTETESGLRYYDIAVGEGDTVNGLGDTVTVNFIIWDADGNVLANSIEQEQPLTFGIGSGLVFPGWEEGVTGMNVGGKRQLVVPPELAPGSPEGGDIILEMELISVELAPTE